MDRRRKFKRIVAAVKDKVGDPPFIGKIREFKWAGKFYEREVLALSGKTQYACVSYSLYL